MVLYNMSVAGIRVMEFGSYPDNADNWIGSERHRFGISLTLLTFCRSDALLFVGVLRQSALNRTLKPLKQAYVCKADDAACLGRNRALISYDKMRTHSTTRCVRFGDGGGWALRGLWNDAVAWS